LLKPFMTYRGNKISAGGQMDKHGGWTVQKHNAFVDNIGW